ncbi:MAG: TIGR03943 family putative permease subunit [Candidatus Flexifilum sp.]|jgi:uncharacterized repeat protein (TIGR03943 family)
MQLTQLTRSPVKLQPDVRRIVLLEIVKSALLIGLGAYFTWLIATDKLPNYINYRFAWLSYVAAALFAIMGLVSGWHVYAHHLRRGRADPDHEHDHPDHEHDHADHQHAPISWGVLAIIALPLALGTLIPSRPLGAEAVGSISTLAAGSVQSTSLAAFQVAPEQRNVLDWLRAFNSAADYNELNGLPVDVVGFVYLEPTFEAGTFMVARFTVSCCVADAAAIGLPVAYADSASLPQGEWVRVRGTMGVGQFRGETLPLVQATSIEVVPQPDHPYLYP